LCFPVTIRGSPADVIVEKIEGFPLAVGGTVPKAVTPPPPTVIG
jgi:hypothetical protein